MKVLASTELGQAQPQLIIGQLHHHLYYLYQLLSLNCWHNPPDKCFTTPASFLVINQVSGLFKTSGHRLYPVSSSQLGDCHTPRSSWPSPCSCCLSGSWRPKPRDMNQSLQIFCHLLGVRTSPLVTDSSEFWRITKKSLVDRFVIRNVWTDKSYIILISAPHTSTNILPQWLCG